MAILKSQKRLQIKSLKFFTQGELTDRASLTSPLTTSAIASLSTHRKDRKCSTSTVKFLATTI
jgi:hypothetical protein